AFAQAQVGEVGRERIHFGTRAGAAQLLEQRALAMPLLGQREGVLALPPRDDLLAQALQLALERPFVRARLLAGLLEVPAHAGVQRDLLVDDSIGQAAPRRVCGRARERSPAAWAASARTGFRRTVRRAI